MFDKKPCMLWRMSSSLVSSAVLDDVSFIETVTALVLVAVLLSPVSRIK